MGLLVMDAVLDLSGRICICASWVSGMGRVLLQRWRGSCPSMLISRFAKVMWFRGYGFSESGNHLGAVVTKEGCVI